MFEMEVLVFFIFFLSSFIFSPPKLESLNESLLDDSDDSESD